MSGLVLLAEDNEAYAKVIQMALAASGFEVQWAEHGRAAIEMIQKRTPDLVVADVMMPVMDGLELVRRLRSAPETTGIPVLMLSALKGEDRVHAALIAGADHYVSKDTPVAEIMAEVQRLIASGDRTVGANQARQPGHLVVVLGAKGGSGKTSMAVNIAAELARDPSERCVLVDLNLEFGSVHAMLDLPPDVTLSELAAADLPKITDEELDQMLPHHSSGVRVVPSVGRPGESELIRDEALAAVVGRLRRSYDHVVIDGRPSFRSFMLDLWETADSLVVTCPPEVISVGVTTGLLRAFASVDVAADKVLLVLDEVSPSNRLSTAQVERTLGRPTLRVPHGGNAFQDCVDLGRVYVAAHPGDPVSRAIRVLAERLIQRRRRNLAALKA
ncbi:MAG: response regulator [Candidatus Dormibacteria bacterium]